MARRRLKLCCITSVVFLVILIAIIVTLSFTIFKPKDPQITIQPVGLKNFNFNITGVTLNTLVTIHNPNYGSFEYKNVTGYVNYRGSTVAEVPIAHNKIPARAKVNMTTSTDLIVGKLISNPSFWEDIGSGYLNFSATATLPGKVSLAKIFKFRATTYTSCYILIYIQSQDADSKCITKIKL
ncbi:uncharacterized protein LOC104456511 [Eucalyptus grandis]|nr:uncharacterized protein LOC104456511 [Eucalyptus grandis]